MKITDNYSLTRLFATKDITIFGDGRQLLKIHLPCLREFYERDDINNSYHVWTKPSKELNKLFIRKMQDSFDVLNAVLFEYGGRYKEYNTLKAHFESALKFLNPDVNIDGTKRTISFGSTILTSEI